jgi:ATP-dependent protease ClpP protease subunit
MTKKLLSIVMLLVLLFPLTVLAEEKKEVTFITVFGGITSEVMSDITLTSLTVPSFTLLINSYGGDVDSAISFYNLTRKTKPDFKTVGLGTISSSAVILFCSAKKRVISSRAYMVLHPISSEGATLEPGALKKMNDFLTKVYSEIVSSSTNGKLKPEDVVGMMKDCTFLTGEEVFKLGIATELSAD